MIPRLIFAAFVTTAFASLPLLADAPTGPTPYPTSNADWPGKGTIRVFGWFKDHRENFWKLRDKQQGFVILTGDSLIENWKNAQNAFPNLHVANRGIGGDVSRGLLFRFKEDVLDLHPKCVVILIGTNDLSAHGNPDDAISNISDMVNMAKKQSADMPVILCTVPPRNSPIAPTQPGKQDQLNDKIKALADGKKAIAVVDLVPVFAKPDGSPDPQYFQPDLLHFAPPGYAKFQEVLQKTFSDLHIQ